MAHKKKPHVKEKAKKEHHESKMPMAKKESMAKKSAGKMCKGK